MAAVAGALLNGLVVIVGGRRDISQAVAGGLEGAAGHALGCVVGRTPCLALLGVARWREAEGLVGVGDLVAVAVVLDQPCGMAPGALAADAVGEWA